MTTTGPTTAGERNLKEWDFFLLWAGAAISLSEIWAGGLLASFGLAAGLLVIGLGHLVGNTPMALGGLWHSPFSRQAGSPLARLAQLRPLRRVTLTVGEPVAPLAATPERLRREVLALRGEAR